MHRLQSCGKHMPTGALELVYPLNAFGDEPIHFALRQRFEASWFLVDETEVLLFAVVGRLWVRVRARRPGPQRAEIHFDRADFRSAEAEAFGVPDPRTDSRFERVADQRFASVLEQAFDVKRADVRAVGPALFEVRSPVDVVVGRA